MDERFVNVNANNQVKVKLNPEGIELLRKEHYELYNDIKGRNPNIKVPLFELQLDEEGYYETQIWSFMNTFGPHTNIAKKPLFDTDMLVKIDKPKEEITWHTEKNQ